VLLDLARALGIVYSWDGLSSKGTSVLIERSSSFCAHAGKSPAIVSDTITGIVSERATICVVLRFVRVLPSI
jgi:hypothetical protein